ncbi:hypothetical protein ACFFK0_20335 [Paenibacillus chartarius]|uniref:PilZ domain-containing protein n=1 Tax=Paenibacillus chartarius TaxID=747481 RepID=A0ABV6DQ42_9BACL
MKQLKIKAHGLTFDTPVVNSNAVFWEIKEPEYARLRNGEQVALVERGTEVPMQVMKCPRRDVILTPLGCDLNEIYREDSGIDEEAYNSEELIFDSYRLNTFGVLSGKQFNHSVRIVSISKLGIGFTISKFMLNFDETYRLNVICDEEPISLQASIRYAHLIEKGIYYSAAIKSIKPRDLEVLRYYTASQQLR